MTIVWTIAVLLCVMLVVAAAVDEAKNTDATDSAELRAFHERLNKGDR